MDKTDIAQAIAQNIAQNMPEYKEYLNVFSPETIIAHASAVYPETTTRIVSDLVDAESISFGFLKRLGETVGKVAKTVGNIGLNVAKNVASNYGIILAPKEKTPTTKEIKEIVREKEIKGQISTEIKKGINPLFIIGGVAVAGLVLIMVMKK
jgi:hypothetical protein